MIFFEKYIVIQEKSRHLKALRYGKEWRDCCGDNLIYALASEIEILRNKTHNVLEKEEL